MTNFIQMLKKKERKKEDLEFALKDRRPRCCAEAPVISRFIKLFEKVNRFHLKAIERKIAKRQAKSTKNLKLRIRQNAYNEKHACDRMKNKSFYQTF